MDFRLSPEEENLRKSVEEFVREDLIPLEPEFENAPDIFEGSRWKSRAKLSHDPEVKRYVEMMENLEKQAEARGLWYLDVPKEDGGAEVSNVAMIAITEELEKTSIPFELGVYFAEETARDRLGGPAPRVKGRVRGMQGGISGGSAASGAATMAAIQTDRASLAVRFINFSGPAFSGR